MRPFNWHICSYMIAESIFPRAMTTVVSCALDIFPVLVLRGARQTGKSTLAKIARDVRRGHPASWARWRGVRQKSITQGLRVAPHGTDTGLALAALAGGDGAAQLSHRAVVEGPGQAMVGR